MEKLIINLAPTGISIPARTIPPFPFRPKNGAERREIPGVMA